MKKLVMIRHSKSSWGDTSIPDFERGLNSRGKHDAPMMGEILKEKGHAPGHVILSSSKRTNATWKKMNKSFELNDNFVQQYDDLYHSSPGDILRIISQQSDDIETLYCIVHNPGITSFVNMMCGVDIFNIPTTGIAVIEVPRFSNLELGEGELLEYFYPKQFKD